MAVDVRVDAQVLKDKPQFTYHSSMMSCLVPFFGGLSPGPSLAESAIESIEAPSLR